jgi:Leucine-rich repeat (LRR) protein
MQVPPFTIRFVQLLACVLPISLLAGCFKVDLGGPVEDSTIEIKPYDFYGNYSYFTGRGLSRSDYRALLGDEKWDSYPNAVQLNLLGWGAVGDGNVLADEYYGARASGGTALDIDGDSIIDAVPTPVNGVIHGYLTGRQIRSAKARLNPLTEAIFQHLRWTEDIYYPLGPQLDKFARRYVSDLNNDGNISYEDLFELHSGNFPDGDYPHKQAWDAMVAAIVANDTEAQSSLSFELLDMDEASFLQVKDEVLRQCARATAEPNLASIRTLPCTYGSASTLEGIEQMQGLIHLDLTRLRFPEPELDYLSQLTGLETLILERGYFGGLTEFLAPLSGLKTLKLIEASIENLDFLEGLTELEELDLSDNELYSYTSSNAPERPGLTPLTALTKLRVLSLRDVRVTDYYRDEEGTLLYTADFSPLAELPSLTHLDFYRTNVENTDFLQGLLNLESLNFRYSDATVDLSKLSALKALKHLDLRSVTVENFEGVSALDSLESLVLNVWGAEGGTELQALPALESLDIEVSYSKGEGFDFGFLALQTSLKRLDLDVSVTEQDVNGIPQWTESIFDLEQLSMLTSLVRLDVYRDSENLAALAALTDLRELTLEIPNVTDLSPLAGMTAMVELDLYDGNRVTEPDPIDLVPLSAMTSLKVLRILVGEPTDISVLSNFQELEELTIEMRLVEDWSPLYKLPRLRRLHLVGSHDPSTNTGAKICEKLAKLKGAMPRIYFEGYIGGCPA